MSHAARKFKTKDDKSRSFYISIYFQVSAAIPASFFQLCELLEGMIPDCVHPLCDSVIAHIMIRNSQMTDYIS